MSGPRCAALADSTHYPPQAGMATQTVGSECLLRAIVRLRQGDDLMPAYRFMDGIDAVEALQMPRPMHLWQPEPRMCAGVYEAAEHEREKGRAPTGEKVAYPDAAYKVDNVQHVPRHDIES